MFFVYRFINKKQNVIYVGKSKKPLVERFKGHLHLPDECYSMVHKIEYIECKTEADMSIKEIYYINKYSENQPFYNVQDKTDIPRSVEFNDKWKMYRGSLPAQFSRSLNVKNNYSLEQEIKTCKNGQSETRGGNKREGVSSFAEPLSTDEVDKVTKYLVNEIALAENNNQRQIRFRNLVMFVLGVNLPIKSKDFLSLKYKDLIDNKNKITPYKLVLNRLYKDETIELPLPKNAKKILRLYMETYGITYDNNAEDSIFMSRKHNSTISTQTAWHIISEPCEAVGISKNVATESLRKTYYLHRYNNSENTIEALIFLETLSGSNRYGSVISYMNVFNEEDVRFDYYFGEQFALCNINFSKLKKALEK